MFGLLKAIPITDKADTYDPQSIRRIVWFYWR